MNTHGIKKLHGSAFAGLSFALMVCLYVIIAFVGQTILNVFDNEKDTLYFIVNSLFSVLAMEIVIRIANRDRHEVLALEHYFKKVSIKYVLYAVIFAVGMFLGFGFVNELVHNFLSSVGVEVHSSGLTVTTIPQLLLYSVFYGVIPAFEEEAFFRGLLRENLKSEKKWITILTLSLVFGIYHCSLVKFVYQFIFGLGLTIIAMKTGSVLPTMIAHLLNNVVIIILSYFNVQINFFSPITILIGLSSLFVFVILMINDYQQVKHETKDHDEKYNATDFWLPFGLFGVIICVVIAISGVVVH